jgi:hypothetical protein
LARGWPSPPSVLSWCFLVKAATGRRGERQGFGRYGDSPNPPTNVGSLVCPRSWIVNQDRSGQELERLLAAVIGEAAVPHLGERESLAGPYREALQDTARGVRGPLDPGRSRAFWPFVSDDARTLLACSSFRWTTDSPSKHGNGRAFAHGAPGRTWTGPPVLAIAKRRPWLPGPEPADDVARDGLSQGLELSRALAELPVNHKRGQAMHG